MRFLVVRVRLRRFHGAYLIALLRIVETHTLGALVWVNHIELVSLRDGLIRALGFAGTAGDAFFGDDECHSGRFVTAIAADGSTRQVEIRCDVEAVDNGRGDHTDGYFTDPWTFHIDSYPEEEES